MEKDSEAQKVWYFVFYFLGILKGFEKWSIIVAGDIIAEIAVSCRFI